jgi:methyl-accepting chemotaxis protein
MGEHGAPAPSGMPAQRGSWRLLIPFGRRALLPLKRWVADWRSRATLLDERKALRTIQHDLAEFSGSAEKFFVPVGERLADLHSRSREIARQTTQIAELLSQDERSLAVLGEVLNAGDGGGQHGEVLAAVQGIQQNAVAVQGAIATVVRLVNTFDVLGIMTRIESSRFEAEGASFGGLAQAVSALSQQIREKIGTTAESAAVLLQTSRQAAAEVRHVEQTRQENLGPLTRQTSLGLAKTRDHRNRVSHASKLLAARFDGVSSAVGDIVTALQFHDIVRQQIEHVLEALQVLDSPGHSANLGETVRLQAAQLENSRATFQRSVEQIRNALGQIESNIGEVAVEAGRLVGSPDGGDVSFFAGVEADLASILGILGRNAEADRHLAEVAGSVHQRVSEMSGTIAGVHVIGIEMQRIALNATIQAAHLGPAGAALEIVAQAIQGLARDSEAASGTIEDHLRNTGTAVRVLQQATGGSNRSNEVFALLRKNAAALKSVQGEANEGYIRASDSIAGMKQQIGETITMFGSTDGCLETLGRANEMLRGLSIDAQRTGSQGVGSVAATYTMQSERAVHQSLYDTAPRDQDFPPASAPAAMEEDNVEFF